MLCSHRVGWRRIGSFSSTGSAEGWVEAVLDNAFDAPHGEVLSPAIGFLKRPYEHIAIDRLQSRHGCCEIVAFGHAPPTRLRQPGPQRRIVEHLGDRFRE